MPATTRARTRSRRLLAAVLGSTVLLAGCGAGAEPDGTARVGPAVPDPPPAATPAAVEARVLTGTVELHGPHSGAAEERCANRDDTIDLQSGMTVRVLDGDGEPLGRGWLGDGTLSETPADAAPSCLFPWEIRGIDGAADAYRVSIGGLHELGPWSAAELDALGWDVRLTLGTPGPRPAPAEAPDLAEEATPMPAPAATGPPSPAVAATAAATDPGRSAATAPTPSAAGTAAAPRAPAPLPRPAPAASPKPTPAPSPTPAPPAPSVTGLRLVECRYDPGTDTVEGAYELRFADAADHLLPGGEASTIHETGTTAATPGRLSARVPNPVISPTTARWHFTMAPGAGTRGGFTLPVLDTVRLLDASGAAHLLPVAQTAWSWADAGCGP